MRRLLLAWCMAALCCVSVLAGRFAVGEGKFLLDGEPFVIRAAELHYPRIPRAYWAHRIEMCKALGMNTICLYVFWNIHEPAEGEFDFTGNNDVAAFCRLAQEHGMWVIVRPGPYVCAEWEMGGLPWWLLKDADIGLRSLDPRFIDRVRRFEAEVGRQLAPLTVDRGGPILMVQVENEYGSYGTDKPYVSAIRDILRASGFDGVTLFQCDWSSNFELNGLDDLLWTMNFGTGSDIDREFERLRSLRPASPLMCSEFWSGWFDKWGGAHETRPAADMVAGIDQMLSRGISFSLYMTHGGTSFGHWAGANSPGFAPDVTSYDYDAPINEWGLATEKYWLLRGVLQRHAGSPLPDVPAPPMPVVATPRVSLSEYAPLEAGVRRRVRSDRPLTFEQMDMGFGSAIYTATLAGSSDSALLEVPEIHDYAIVLLNGHVKGVLNRVTGATSLTLPPTRAGDRLTLVVEAMGRINFGRAIADRKGIAGDVRLRGNVLTGWDIDLIPDSYGQTLAAFGNTAAKKSLHTDAGYYRGTFDLDSVGDTFLDMRTWGKGLVYVNGHGLGRFWNVGPQQTLYLPGCWLRKGSNEVIVLDVAGPAGEPVVAGLTTPILDKTGDSVDAPQRTPRPDVNQWPVVARCLLNADNRWQRFDFDAPVAAGSIAIEITATKPDTDAAIAEIQLIDTDGHRIDPAEWTVAYVDSEQKKGNHTADKLIDLQESTHWRASGALPQLVVIDLGNNTGIQAVEILPYNSPETSLTSCRIKAL